MLNCFEVSLSYKNICKLFSIFGPPLENNYFLSNPNANPNVNLNVSLHYVNFEQLWVLSFRRIKFLSFEQSRCLFNKHVLSYYLWILGHGWGANFYQINWQFVTLNNAKKYITVLLTIRRDETKTSTVIV